MATAARSGRSSFKATFRPNALSRASQTRPMPPLACRRVSVYRFPALGMSSTVANVVVASGPGRSQRDRLMSSSCKAASERFISSPTAARPALGSPPCLFNLRSTKRSTSALSIGVIQPKSISRSPSAACLRVVQSVQILMNRSASMMSACRASTPNRRLRSASIVGAVACHVTVWTCVLVTPRPEESRGF